MHNSLKETVLQSVDLVDVVGERISLTRKGKDFVGLCPFHPDHTPSLSVSAKKQIFKCWSCGAGGDVIKFVQMYDHVDFREALLILARRAGIDTASMRHDPQASALRDKLRQATEWARSHFQRNLWSTPAGEAAVAYARRRGLNDETMKRHGLGFAPDAWDDVLKAANKVSIQPETLEQAGLVAKSDKGKIYDRFRNRLMFPICDGSGRPIAFGGRTLGDDPAKYLNSPETPLFSKSRVLYGLDLARKAVEEHQEAIVVEGYLDAVLLRQYGFEQAVATLGTALTDAHVKLLRPLTETVVFCFDGDQAGQKAADRAVETALRHNIRVRVALLTQWKDPADCVTEAGAEAFAGVLKSAIDALQFKWSLMVKSFGDQPRTRRIAAEEFLRFVAEISAAGGLNPLDQGLLVGRLSDLLALPTASVYGLLVKAKAATKREASSITPDTLDDTSAYTASIRGLPAGLVTAVEGLFGVLLTDSKFSGLVDGAFQTAVGYSEPWRRLHLICRQLQDEFGDFTRADVLARCEDSELCELASRSCAQVDEATPLDVALRLAHERLRLELDSLQRNDLRGRLQKAQADDAGGEQAFRSLLEVGRRQNAVLPTENP